jgi:hypothetical protein
MHRKQRLLLSIRGSAEAIEATKGDKGSFRPIPLSLLEPPSCEVAYPTVPNVPYLPFTDLGWEDFQRLCLAIGHCRYPTHQWKLYGSQGHRQEGIDLIALPANDQKLVVVQCKRVSTTSVSKIRTACDLFLRGVLAASTREFILSFSFLLIQPALIDEIARQRVLFHNRHITLRIWDAEELSSFLKSQPEIVTRFFGRPWGEVFCPGREHDYRLPPPVQQAVEQLLTVLRQSRVSLSEKLHQTMNLLKSAPLDSSEIRRFLSPVYLSYHLEMDYSAKSAGCNRVSTRLLNLSTEPIASDWEDLWGTVPVRDSDLRLTVYPTKGRRIHANISESESTAEFKKVWFVFDPPLKSGEFQRLRYSFYWKAQAHIPGLRWHEFMIDSPIVTLKLTVNSPSVRFGNVLEYDSAGLVHRLLSPAEYRVQRDGGKHSILIKAPAFKRRYRIEYIPT